ncbi:MAG: pyruvate dehydrogenase complex dihydrolipoamide acetyltransferase [Pseudomonadota bacterium]
MPIKILMPALSPTMIAGNLAKWLKKEGDRVKPGDVIAEIETDKATMEMEVVDEGILAKIIVPEGTEGVSVNSLIAIILEEGEDASALDNMSVLEQPALKATEDKSSNVDAAPSRQDSMSAKNDQPGNNQAESNHRVFASPLAKRIAEDKNIDLKKVVGTGPHGRIVKADVLSSNSQISCAKTTQRQRSLEEFTTKKHSNVGKIIAKRLLESKQTIPHFYLMVECNLDKLLDFRSELNNMAGHPPSYKLSVNDFIIKASALAMRDIPEVNASWDDQHLVMYSNVDISIAVAAPTGLITPVIKNADFKSLPEISNEIKGLATRARENKLTPEEFQGGGFTISNLGMYGIRQFSAIINPPQSCILAVGEGSKRVIAEGLSMKIATMMDVTLSCDHRVVDGVLGARFLQKFKEYIESPVRIILLG